ncbi:MAG: HD-GYP domain-containing protein [Pirellulales bacterium]|nr:HD-GYP domain-containing protein [Pirellulales bacterium]
MLDSQQTPFAQNSVPRVLRGGKDDALETLRAAFDVEFNVLDIATGERIETAGDQPGRDWSVRAELCREVARRGKPEFIDEEDPLLVLAVPLDDTPDEGRVAVATFVSRPVGADEPLDEAGRLLGLSPDDARDWIRRRPVWGPEMLRKVAGLVADQLAAHRRIERLADESHLLSENLSSTYEEISLLYRITQRLKISQSDEELGRAALEWLSEVIPARGLALLLKAIDATGSSQVPQRRSADVLVSHGECPIDVEGFQRLIDLLGLRPDSGPFVANPPVTSAPAWPHDAIRQLIIVPLAEGDNVFGWLAAMNHAAGGEFGTVEASLMSSVGTILGIHSGNLDLYRQQSEMFSGVVRALASAIDAKDPYTRGHSDRVARVAVRLARELGWDDKSLGTIYLSGLLHDIGKIGIDDQVLRKPGKLTDEEYEHIKQHVTVGHRILTDLRKMDNILPVVLHHHESWDGSGYPRRLPAEEIPQSARIVAVADAFDAMSSDRPYRKGMPDEKIDAIFHEGRGRQWDPDVVDAFFRVRDDIRDIARHETGDLADLHVWA